MFHLVSSLPWQPTSVPLYPCLFFLLCFVFSFLYVVLFVALPPQGIQQGALCRACVCDTVRSGALSEFLVCYGLSWCLFYGYVSIDFSIFFASFVFCGATASASYLYLCIFCCGRTCPLVGIFCIVCVCVCSYSYLLTSKRAMQRRSRRRRLRTCFKLRQLLLLVLPLLQLFSVAYFLGSLHLGIYLHLHWPPVRKLLLPATAAVVHFILQIVCRNLCLVLAASVASQIYELSYTYEYIYMYI